MIKEEFSKIKEKIMMPTCWRIIKIKIITLIK